MRLVMLGGIFEMSYKNGASWEETSNRTGAVLSGLTVSALSLVAFLRCFFCSFDRRWGRGAMHFFCVCEEFSWEAWLVLHYRDQVLGVTKKKLEEVHNKKRRRRKRGTADREKGLVKIKKLHAVRRKYCVARLPPIYLGFCIKETGEYNRNIKKRSRAGSTTPAQRGVRLECIAQFGVCKI